MKREAWHAVVHGVTKIQTQLNWTVLNKAPVPRFTDTCFLAVSELCKDTARTHCTIPWKKRCHCRVFCECWLPYWLLLWLDETTVKWLPSKKRQAACCLQKHEKLDQICCYNEEKHERVCFPGRFVAVIIQVSQGKNPPFAIRPQFPSSQKHVSQQLQSCVKTPLGHSVTFHQKRG